MNTSGSGSGSGRITDYLAHGPRPDADVEQDGGIVRVQPNRIAPSIAAKYPRGISFQGPWETYADGFCEHTRRLSRALSLAGVPVHLRSVWPRARNAVGEDRLVDAEYADLLHQSIAEYSAQVKMVVPAPGLLSRLVSSRYYTPEQLAHINARIVLSTVWERLTGVAADDVAAFNAVGQAWVGCSASRDLLVQAGVAADKVRVVPCPYLPDDPHLALAKRQRRPGVPRFCHIGKWEPRKEQRRILLAFMRAFQPGSALLMLKTSERAPPYADYPLNPAAALVACLSDPRVVENGWTAENVERDIIILARRLTGEQMLALHRTADVYVSLSRGEGFDMPAFDAKLSGNLLVYTPSGGPQSFAGDNDELVEAIGTEPCHPFYRWPDGSSYIDYSLDEAALALQRAWAKVNRGMTLSARRGRDLGDFSAGAVGALMRGHLAELGVTF